MTDALSLALQKIAEGDSPSVAAALPASQSPPERVIPAVSPPPLPPVAQASVAPVPLPSVERSDSAPAAPTILPITGHLSPAAPPVAEVPQTATLRIDTPVPGTSTFHHSPPTVAAGLARLAASATPLPTAPNMATAPVQPAAVQSAAADAVGLAAPPVQTASTPASSARSTPQGIGSPVTTFFARIQEYRTALAAAVVVAVVAVVWNDSREAAQTDAASAAAEINIEQLLQEFETADQRASERNARRALELAEEQDEPDFPDSPETPRPSPRTRQRAAVYSQESSTSPQDSETAVYPGDAIYPNENNNSAAPQPTVDSASAESTRPVRFTGRIQPMQ